MSVLDIFLSSYNIELPQLHLLPLFHSCECFDSISILRDARLSTHQCPVFGEELLYFFYGKPAYPAGEKEKKYRTDIDYCPVCFIVNPEIIPIYKIFPFDSGAFTRNMYSDFFYRRVALDDYSINNSLEALLKYIAVFYENNSNYIRGNAVIRLPIFEEHIDSLIRLLNPNGAYNIDERSHTVEVISNQDVVLDKAVECIILPEDLLRYEVVQSFFSEHKIPHREYIVRTLTSPSRYNEVIFSMAMDYLEERNIDG